MPKVSLCLPLFPFRSCAETTIGILPQIATSDDGARGLGQSAVKGWH